MGSRYNDDRYDDSPTHDDGHDYSHIKAAEPLHADAQVQLRMLCRDCLCNMKRVRRCLSV